MLAMTPLLFLLVCLVGSLQGQPLQRVNFSSCQNEDFEIRCSNINESIWIQKAVHSVADLWQCRDCSSRCMKDEGFGRSSLYSNYGWSVATLCNGRNMCQLEKWCGSDCVETINATFFCAANKETSGMTGQLPTPPPDTGDIIKAQDFGLASVPGVELQRAYLSTCANQTFDIGCSDNSSIIILSAAHSVSDPWNCPDCNSTCMGGQFYSRSHYSSGQTYRSHHSHRSYHHTRYSYYHTYRSQHHSSYSPSLIGRLSAQCNACPQCTIDKWCDGSRCVEAYNITYYCVNSTNIGTTCWKPGSPDYVVLRQCPVRINPALRSGGSPTTQVTLTILTPYRNQFYVCRWSDRNCRLVTTRNITITGGFSLLPAGYTPVIIQLDYHINTTDTSKSGPMSAPASGASTTASAVGGVQQNAGQGIPVEPVRRVIKVSQTETAALPTIPLDQTKSEQLTTSTLTPEPSSSPQTPLTPDNAKPFSSVTGIKGINTAQKNPAEGVRAVAANGGLDVVDIIGIAAAMVVLLVLIVVVAILVTFYRRHCLPSAHDNLKRRPVLDNFYITDSERSSSSTGTTDTDWITIEEAYNQRHRNSGSLQQPPLPSLPPRHY